MKTFLTSSFLLLVSFPRVLRARCTCNDALDGAPEPATLSNTPQQVAAILIKLIPGTMGLPHHLAIVNGAMFDAFADKRDFPRLTAASPDIPPRVSAEKLAGYAGYAAMRNIFTMLNPDKVPLLDKAMRDIGLVNVNLRDNVASQYAKAVAMRFPLNMPPPPYTAPNPPSTLPGNAQCSNIGDSDGWQALCTPSPDGGCIPQQVPILGLNNASLIHRNGARDVENLISFVPAPPTYSGPLRRVPIREDTKDFFDPYRQVLVASRNLNDEDKIIAEVFSPNAALGVLTIALNEASKRKLNADDTRALLFAVTASTRDALVGSTTIKLRYSTIRPVSLIQCAFLGQDIRAWAGPYKGVKSFKNTGQTRWRSYIQTPPFPGYISGHTSVAGAGAEVLRMFFKGGTPKAANCFIRMAGESLTEPRIRAGEAGHIAGVTDVPSRGFKTMGFSPAKQVTVCWRTFEEYAKLEARSRLKGGVHTPVENRLGLQLGRKTGRRTFRFVAKRRTSM